LEEIVGDFTTNQAEDEQEEIIKLEHRTFEIDGSATIRDVNKTNNWDLPTDGPKTISGLVLEHLENIPDGNITFTIGHYRFETLKLSGKKVAKLKVQRLLMSNRSEEDEEDEN